MATASPALPLICEDISFLPFHSPPSPSSKRWDQWVESLEAIDYDLSYLLRLPHAKFWTQVIRDKSLSCFLDSYLQQSLRPYEEAWSVPNTVLELLRNIHRRVFMVFLRMSTNKEDQTNQYSPEAFGDLIHTHSLFTIPRLLDLCSIYGNSNRQLLAKMVDNVMTKQPQYLKELEQVMTTGVQTAFDNLIEKTTTGDMSLKDVVDLVLYFTDLTYSLDSLLLVYPLSSTYLWKVGLTEKLVHCYEAVLPSLLTRWKELQYKCDNSSYIKQCLHLIKLNTTKIVHTILMSCCHDNSRAESENQILTYLSSITSGKVFIKDFEKSFSLRECCRSLSEAYPNLDDMQLQYILTSVFGEATPPLTTPTTVPPSKSERAPDVKKMVNYIKEMLPQLEDDFLKNCLKEFHFNEEVVLHHLLEGTLPPHLLSQQQQDLPPSETTPPSEITPLPALEEGQSILEGRLGAYDYDDFDLLRRKDVDFSKIHVGKKHESITDILSDRSHVKHMKGVGLDLLPLDYDEYDDEYDDTYDSHNIGSLEQDNTGELFTVRRLNIKGQFASSRGHKWVRDDSEGEEEEKEVIVPVEPVQLLQRPVTPDKIKKEKSEQETAAAYKKPIKGGGGGRKQGKAVTGPSKNKKQPGGKRDDTREDQTSLPTNSGASNEEERREGKGRGTVGRGGGGRGGGGRGDGGGDQRDTDRQRAYNERHKGSRANHNRRALADRKRGAAGFH